MATIFENFTNQYAVSKTLRFELIPDPKTREYIEKKGFIKQDEERAEKYKKVKKIIDEYHKEFIEKALGGLNLKGLHDYMVFYLKNDKDDKEKISFEKVQGQMRKEIADAFKKHEKFNLLFGKELIRNELIHFCSEEDKEKVASFSDFTTYFGGFHKNRKNMYVADAKATAIAYRLIHENLPKFIDNTKIFEKIKTAAPEFATQLNNVLIEMKEITNDRTLEGIFSVDYFNETLTQGGIDLYNTIIGGRTADEGRKKIKGLNEYINTEYNQKQTDKKKRLPKFKQLYKQILSDRLSFSFLADGFQNDNDVLEAIEQFYSGELLDFTFEGKTVNVLETIKNTVANLDASDLSKIYFRCGTTLSNLSQKTFGDWSLIGRALEAYYDKTYPIRPREKTDKYEERKAKWLKQDLDIATLQAAINCYDNETVKENNNGKVFSDFFTKFCNDEKRDFIEQVQSRYSAIKDLLNTPPNTENEKLCANKDQVRMIKAFLDSIMNIIHFVRPLSIKDADKQKDEVFYSQFTPLFDQLTQTIGLYNKVRNYLTQKPYSTEKFKLNFENPDLLGGWPVDRELATSGVIFKDDNLYYLGILDKNNKKYFKYLPRPNTPNDVLLKMNYLQAADPSKDVQNLMVINGKTVKKNGRKEKDGEFAGENIKLEELKNAYLPAGINGIRKNRTYSKQSEKFTKADLTKFIDFYKKRTVEYYKSFDFVFKKSEEYSDFSDFTEHINQQAYQIKFAEISKSFVNTLVAEGKLYLFQIYNKDFSPHSKGKPNLHTLYWKMLFDDENLKDVVYKLNGEAEVFFRRKSITEKSTVIHKAHAALDNKNPDSPKPTSKFDYDIVKDRRYTVDKFQFHVPITMNFKARGIQNINPGVNEVLRDDINVNIIGIDRGERHLLYYTIINPAGKIIKQDTLNVIANEKQKVNYHQLLHKKEGDRETARQEWGVIENIKELKEGYLSQVIHKLTDLMVKHNAVIVMEDLNFGFKRGRQKVEKQVYQKFEKMLIDKLNYFVDKSKKTDELGGLLSALQVANKFESFQKLGKQNGLIFYVPAWNTSKIDPATGFVDLLKPKYESKIQAKSFFEKFTSIRFNKESDYFEFAFDYANFTEKAEGSRTNWTVCTTNEIRYVWNKDLNNKRGGQEQYDVTGRLKALFDAQNIEYKTGTDIKEQILRQETAPFFGTLMKALCVTLGLRYNNGEKGDQELDYILSPVADSKGHFFDSRKADDDMPQNADANGAYHIALKGLLVLGRLREKGLDAFEKSKKVNKDGKSQWLPNKEWLQFKQSKVS